MFKEVVGQNIIAIEMPDEEHLTFHTAERPYAYEAYAECCSQSWIASISGIEAITNATVREIRSKSQTLFGTRQDYDAVDFVTIVTDKGYFDVEFRNSSNGYYGGNMELMPM